MNTLTTSHNINYKGFTFTIKGKHETLYRRNSKMDFVVYLNNSGVGIGKHKLKGCLEKLIAGIGEKQKRDEFHASYKSLNIKERIEHVNFLYARFQNSSLGNYYNIYWKWNESPTGVYQVGSCSEQEWETISKECGKNNQYLSPTEGRKVY